MTDTWTTTVSEDVWTSSTNPGTVFQVTITDADAGGGVSDHGALTGLGDNDHTQYQLLSAKSQANGYAGLDGDATLPDILLPSSIARDSEIHRVMRVAVAVADDASAIVFGDPAPADVAAALVWGRASGNGVYSLSMTTGWTLLDPQPRIVVAESMFVWPDLGTSLYDAGVNTLLDRPVGGEWQVSGILPSVGGNPSQVWGPSGWVAGGSGDVVGPASAVDSKVVLFDGTTGKLVKDSGVTLGTAAAAATGDFAAASHTHTGTQVTVDASGFNGNLTTSDDTLQEVAQKLDDLSIPAAGISASIIDAKGDLIAGTAADTAARLAIGSAGQVLTPDTTTSVGMKWQTPASGNGGKVPGVNSYFSIDTSAWNSGTPTAGTLHALPIRLNAGTLDRIVIELFGGSAGTAYAALYADDGTGWPGEQIVMATISTASSGRIATTVSQAIPAGDYWMVSESSVAVSQVVATITGIRRRVNSRINDSGEFYAAAGGYALASHNDAPPSTFPTSGTFSSALNSWPAFFLRYA